MSEQARIVNEAAPKSNTNKVITYVDCNAVSPNTSIKIGNTLSQKHFNFVDSIVVLFDLKRNSITLKYSLVLKVKLLVIVILIIT